jgi:hypothetical protein
MKKLLQLGAIFCGMLMAQLTYADSYMDNNAGGCCPTVAQNACDRPCEDQPVQSDCWVKYCHMEPCYYTTCRCEDYQVPCTRRCCRYVDEPYQVTKCRYVPQYYCETCCRKVPQWYDVQETKCCKRYVQDQHCRYVPRYYWKHVGGCQQACEPSCPTACPTGGCQSPR